MAFSCDFHSVLSVAGQEKDSTRRVSEQPRAQIHPNVCSFRMWPRSAIKSLCNSPCESGFLLSDTTVSASLFSALRSRFSQTMTRPLPGKPGGAASRCRQFLQKPCTKSKSVCQSMLQDLWMCQCACIGTMLLASSGFEMDGPWTWALAGRSNFSAQSSGSSSACSHALNVRGVSTAVAEFKHW